MATLKIRTLKELEPSVRKRIRQALNSCDDGELSAIDDAMALPHEWERQESKWHNVRTAVDEIFFDSNREAKRYVELNLESLAGEICDLELQKRFSLDVNGVHICDYVADFVYKRDGIQVVEDAKGKPTDVYVIKRKLMLAVHGIKIVES
jgi:uncharacterized protein DUF1064